VGSLVLLLESTEPSLALAPDVVQELAALGVTNVTVLRDEHTTAVALDGWAFDSDRSADTAARLVSPHRDRVSVLRPVLESAIHTHGRQASERS
jgi:hypothetical protein